MTSRSSAIPPGAQAASTRSPVLAILGGFATGAVVAVLLVLGPAARGPEPAITGSVLVAIGLGWGLMAWLSMRFSAQPQAWMAVPAALLGVTGLALLVVRPGAAVMDALGWIWPPVLAIVAVWMVVRVRRELRGPGRWLVVPMIATFLILAVGGAIATVGAATRSDVAAATGRMVDVGGRRLSIECTGAGSPTVILQAGLGESSASWGRIAPDVAASTTVCVYDRAGHGRSDEAGPQDGIALATDLHTLLERAGVAGPYVLVGHSSGGAYARVFAERYAHEIAGLVLLDAQPADAFDVLPDYPAFYQAYRRVGMLSPSLARIGLFGPVLGLSAEASTPTAARGWRDEIISLPAALQQAQALTSIGARPLIVVSAGAGQQAGWLEAQDDLPRLSTNSAHRVLATATHASLITGDDAPASTRAVLDVVTAIRSGAVVR